MHVSLEEGAISSSSGMLDGLSVPILPSFLVMFFLSYLAPLRCAEHLYFLLLKYSYVQVLSLSCGLPLVIAGEELDILGGGMNWWFFFWARPYFGE